MRDSAQSLSMQLSRQDVHRLAGEVGCDPRTVDKWAEDESTVIPAVAYALRAAAAKLGIDVAPLAEAKPA